MSSVAWSKHEEHEELLSSRKITGRILRVTHDTNEEGL